MGEINKNQLSEPSNSDRPETILWKNKETETQILNVSSESLRAFVQRGFCFSQNKSWKMTFYLMTSSEKSWSIADVMRKRISRSTVCFPETRAMTLQKSVSCPDTHSHTASNLLGIYPSSAAPLFSLDGLDFLQLLSDSSNDCKRLDDRISQSTERVHCSIKFLLGFSNQPRHLPNYARLFDASRTQAPSRQTNGFARTWPARETFLKLQLLQG